MSDRPTQETINRLRSEIDVHDTSYGTSGFSEDLLAILDDYEKLREVIGDNLPEDELTEEQLRDAQGTKERILGVVKLVKENQGLQKDVQRLTEEVEMWKKSNERWAILAQSPSSYDD